MSWVFKILGDDEWRAAQAQGRFLGSRVDVQDGFIHLSSAEQARETAAKWFAGRADLWLVAVDAEDIAANLKWEPSRGGALFPHLYAPLALTSVVWARPLPLAADGRHEFGELAP